jgi:hypothetical protein
VVEAICGNGYVLPPMVILFIKSGGLINDDTLLDISGTGHSNDVLSLEWLKHFE